MHLHIPRHTRTLLGCALLACASTAWSATPTDDSLRELLVLTQGERTLTTAYGDIERNMLQGAQAGLNGRQPTPAELQLLKSYASEVSAVLRKGLSWAQLQPAMLAAYRDTYTQEEVDAQIAFYRSPVGQSISAKMPVVMQRSMAASQQLMLPLIPQLKDIEQRMRASQAQLARAQAASPAKP